RLLILASALSALVALVATAAASAAPALPSFAKGPFTIRGKVLDLYGKPVVGFPLFLIPMNPTSGMDVENVYWKIPNRNIHPTHTDKNGEFVMTGVVDYPENYTHTYRIWAGDDDWGEWTERYPALKACTRVDLSKQLSNEIEVVLKGEPAAGLKLLATTPSGKPFTGTRSVAVHSGRHRYVYTAHFYNGVSMKAGIPLTDFDYPETRILVFNEIDSTFTKERRLQSGKPIDMSAMFLDGPVLKDFRSKAELNQVLVVSGIVIPDLPKK
ncbi:MAG: hypothetical protein ACM3RP_07610, partial [Chitinophagales bacterium]